MSAIVDVCVLVAAHRRDHPHHVQCLDFLDGTLTEGFLWCAHTRNGFLRLVTHSAIFPTPTPISVALSAWAAWTQRSLSEPLLDSKGANERFAVLCHDQRVCGNAVYDLHLASLAIHHGVEIVSIDAGFGNIPGLRWRSPMR